MKALLGWTATCMVCGLVSLVGVPTAAQAGQATGGGTSLEDSPVSSGALVTEGDGSLLGGEQQAAQREADLAGPVAVTERGASATEYEGLSAEAAEKLASSVFQGLVDDPAGGPPALPAGERITGYPSSDAAQVDLGNGKHGLVESTQPLAYEASPGNLTPIDLSLSKVGSTFEPSASPVTVTIPESLAEGVGLTRSGIALTPIEESGSALRLMARYSAHPPSIC